MVELKSGLSVTTATGATRACVGESWTVKAEEKSGNEGACLDKQDSAASRFFFYEGLTNRELSSNFCQHL